MVAEKCLSMAAAAEEADGDGEGRCGGGGKSVEQQRRLGTAAARSCVAAAGEVC